MRHRGSDVGAAQPATMSLWARAMAASPAEFRQARKLLTTGAMVPPTIPYCGLPVLPGELLTRFNLDPLLLASLALAACLQVRFATATRTRAVAACGWIVAAVAFVSPLCALSVSLFSARVGQHMLLVLIAAPLIALGGTAAPQAAGSSVNQLRLSGLLFFAALWFWHMPVPYDATFASTIVYWAMHLSLFGTAIVLWRQLLLHIRQHTGEALVVGALSSMQMGLLGSVLTFASHPLFVWHLTTTQPWGLTPLQDQQLGGVLMWVPGIVLFLFAFVRSVQRVWTVLEPGRPT